jgi:glyoxylase-like metal-dependent hydrolase (beta-lactamase superfamily II)
MVFTMSSPTVSSFIHDPTGTVTHVVSDPVTRRAAIVDSVLDYDPASGCFGTQSADAVIAHVRENVLTVDWLLETHIHADHLSAAPYLKERVGGLICVGARIREVQETWNARFNLTNGLGASPGQFDRLLADDEAIALGEIEGRVIETPGHTAIDVAYIFGDAAFVGDTFFMPDYGVARADFPGGDAQKLYRSLHRILALPEETRLFLCHDYLPAGGRRARATQTTIAAERANVMLAGLSEAEFAARRRARDKDLAPPALLFPALQVNIRGGRLPPAEDNGVAYLKIPLRKGS